MLKILIYCYNPLDGPVFSEGSGIVNRTVIEGEDITLSCNFTGNPGQFAYGYFYRTSDNLELINNGYRITNATIGNTGRYECFARNSVAARELTFNLIVIGEIENQTFFVFN